jgi:N-acetyl-gamma-glutamylphosphate reductase
VEGYAKTPITYSNLLLEAAEKMEGKGEVDTWVMALPDSVCKLFVDAVGCGVKEHMKESVIVDLSFGTVSTILIPLSVSHKLMAKDAVRLFEEKHAGEKLVKIRKEVPELKNVAGNRQLWVSSSSRPVLIVIERSLRP